MTVPHTPRDEMDNVHYLPGAKREASNVCTLPRRSSMALGLLAGGLGDAFDVALGKGSKHPDRNDMIQLSEALDTLALRSRKYGYALSKPTMLVIAQNIESLSEHIMHIAADVEEEQ